MRKKYNYSTNVHVHRAMHKITQAELAEEVGMTRQSISNIENNTPPNLISALKIANYFMVSVHELFNFKEIT